MTIEQYEELSSLMTEVDECEASPEAPYWFRDDESESYCYDCIKLINPDAEFPYDFDGGFCCESDTNEHCEHCGKLLQYTLTNYGVDNELAHFYENGLLMNDPNECYELARVAHGMLTDDPRNIKLLQILRQAKSQITISNPATTRRD